MKLNFLARATGLMALCATLAYADGYNGSPIINYNGTYTGNITITNILEDDNGVYRSTSGTTALQGNILIDLAYGVGVWNVSLSNLDESYIVLETLSDADSIVIRTTAKENGKLVDGIIQTAINGSITVNANKDGSFQELNITSGTGGISAFLGTAYINANTVINSESCGLYAAYTMIAGPPNTLLGTGTIIMTGTVDITAKSNYGGINSRAGIIDLRAVTDTKVASPTGVYVSEGGRVYLGSNLTMTGTTNNAVKAESGGSVTGTGKYIFSGKVETTGYFETSSVDLTFTKGSNFTGYTVVTTWTNTIDFALNQGARWEVTDNSTMTTLNVAQGGVIVFDLKVAASKMFSYINAPEVHLGAGSILTLNFDPGNVQVGDEYTLFTGLATAFDNDTNGTLNALLRSTNGLYQYEYDNPRAGVFRILGIYSIPEPATASLGLFGLAGLMLRRRRA